MSDRKTGYLIDHPLAIAARNDPKNWDLRVLMAGQPVRSVPDHYLDPGVGSAFDQDGVGACVAFSGTALLNAEEARDEGAQLFNTGTWTNSESSTGAFRNYWDLKHGYGSFPGDGIPNVEGSYPEAFWKLALAEGLVDKTGKRHKITAYYSHSLASDEDFAFVQQVLLAFGPVNMGIPWASNWFEPPPAPDYIMPPVAGVFDGHAITLVGWDLIGGVWHATFVQTWGDNWTNSKGIYRIPVSWFYGPPLGNARLPWDVGGQIVWKIVDIQDAPVPPPDPGDKMITIIDKTQRLVDSAVGKQIYKTDGVTPLSKIFSGPTDLASSFLGKDGTGTQFYGVLVSVGGILQTGTLKVSDCTNVRIQGDTTEAVAAEKKRWTDWIGTAPS